jgi:hypothetical protein
MAVAAVLNIHNENICYNADGIGCFSNDQPFTNAAGKLPQSPAEIKVRNLFKYVFMVESLIGKSK